MKIITAYCTETGNKRKQNQDSLAFLALDFQGKKAVFAIVCDGMGGLQKGELASKELILAFRNWFYTDFSFMVTKKVFTERRLYEQWNRLLQKVNRRFLEYTVEKGVTMGTTMSALLIYKGQFFICHVGDSCIYQVDHMVKKLTVDHSLVAEEIRRGLITKEQALANPYRNVLLQCVGALAEVKPQFTSGNLAIPVTFILATDGFIHKMSEGELYDYFCPEHLKHKQQMTEVCEVSTRLLLNRGEQDNITVLALMIQNGE